MSHQHNPLCWVQIYQCRICFLDVSTVLCSFHWLCLDKWLLFMTYMFNIFPLISTIDYFFLILYYPHSWRVLFVFSLPSSWWAIYYIREVLWCRSLHKTSPLSLLSFQNLCVVIWIDSETSQGIHSHQILFLSFGTTSLEGTPVPLICICQAAQAWPYLLVCFFWAHKPLLSHLVICKWHPVHLSPKAL